MCVPPIKVVHPVTDLLGSHLGGTVFGYSTGILRVL